ncbi:MAG: ABC transporter permease subunit [Candidatus Hodarchaeales archaeon]|jgi:ABC-type Na+ efflux pump permease subunit
MMQLKLIWELMKKDWADSFKSKQILLSTTLLPIFLGLGVPIILLLTTSFAPAGSLNIGYEMFIELLPPLTPNWDLLSDKAQSYVMMSIFSQMMILLVPVMIASFVSADTIVGEKERQTIEGLLALPLTDSEVLAAKISSTLLPVLVLTWGMSILYALIIDLITFPELGWLLLPDLRFTLLILIFTPLLAFGTTAFIVTISSRVSSTRDAQQLTGIFVLPVIILIIGQLVIILFNVWLILVGIIVLGGFDLILFYISTKLFNREKLMIQT